MTTTTSTNELTIMKTDKRGRVLTTPQQREAWLDAFEQSGMSGAAFAKLHGLRYTTFANWRNKRRLQNRCNDTSSAFFEEIDIHSSQTQSSGLKVSLPGGACVEVDRAEQFPMVAALLKYLEHSC